MITDLLVTFTNFANKVNYLRTATCLQNAIDLLDGFSTDGVSDCRGVDAQNKKKLSPFR